MKPDFSKAWLAQRRAGDAAVARVKDQELAAMTDEVALAQATRSFRWVRPALRIPGV